MWPDPALTTLAVVSSLARWRLWWNANLLAADSLIAVVATLAGLGGLLAQMRIDQVTGEPNTIPRWGAVLWTVALHAPLALRRTYPLLVGIMIGLVFAGYRQWVVPEYTVSAITIFMTIVAVGHHGGSVRYGRNAVRLGIIALIVAVLVSDIVTRDVPEEIRPVFRVALAYNLAYNVVFVGAAWLLGDVLRRQVERQRALEERGRQLLVEREANARRAVIDERLRIAREVHDVVAHHVSVMGVQAGAARRLVTREPERVVEVLTTVEQSSRQAVDEMHRLLGLLRQSDAVGGTGPLEPQPGLGRLEQLVADSSATGLTVTLAVEGDPDPLPDSVSLSAYRVIQEAITNTVKHAHARRCHVDVRYRPDTVEVTITDDGVGERRDRASKSSGHGIAGMDERVALHGGRLDVGPRDEGGFRVRATLPRRGSTAGGST